MQITYQDLPEWIPGKMKLHSDTLGWSGVSFREYDYLPHTGDTPAISEFLVIEHIHGTSNVQRKINAQWSEGRCKPGDITLLSRATASEWVWDSPIVVRHAYLTNDFLSKVAEEVFDKPIQAIEFKDSLLTRSRDISTCMSSLALESKKGLLGHELLAQSAATQLAVFLLREFSSITHPLEQARHQFSPRETRLIEDMINDQLTTPPSLDELASSTGVGRWSFTQKFKATFGRTLPNYLLEARSIKAQQLLKSTKLSIKEIAYSSGFSDQAHLCRVFKNRLSLTPRQYRENHG